MFCDKCGTALQAGQHFCPACGKEIFGKTQWAKLRRGRVGAHIRLLGILWLAVSAFNTLGGLAILLVAKPVLLHLRELGQGPPEFAWGFIQPLLTLVAIFFLSKALLGFAAGWGLLRREGWARIIALIAGFLALFHPPFGTALGIYTLWVLLPAESEREYAEQAVQAA
jgi:zinc-ribbon domain